MKHRLKGLLALVLSLVMMLGMVTVSYGLPTATEYAITGNTVTHVDSVLSGVATVSGTDGNVTITLKQDVNGRIRFEGNNGNFVLDLAGHTIDGSGTNEALCLDNNFDGSVTIIGSGTLKKGSNNIIYKGFDATLKFDVSDGYDYFTLKKDEADVFTNEKNTTATSLNEKFFEGTTLVLTQGSATTYPVKIGGVRFNEFNLTIDSTDIAGVTGTATYVPTDGTNPATLTLNGFVYNGSYIKSDGNLTLNLIGKNEVTFGASGAAAITVDGNLTIDGKGSLTATGTIDDGIYAEDTVTISGGNVTATGGWDGIYANSVTITGGTVKATGGADCGIYTEDGNVTISGGTVKATGKMYGIFADNGSQSGGMNVTISGGSVEAYATNDTGSIGIYVPGSNGKIAISGDNTQVTVGCVTGLEADIVDILENSTVKINAALTAIDSNTLNMGSDPWYQWSTNNPGETTPISSETKAFALDNYGGTGQNPVPTSLTIEKISTGAPGNTNPYPPYIYNPTPTPEPEGDKVTSSNTFDGGIASAVVVTILSATGGAWLAKKKD